MGSSQGFALGNIKQGELLLVSLRVGSFIHSFIEQVDTEKFLTAQGVDSLDWEMTNVLSRSQAVTGES